MKKFNLEHWAREWFLEQGVSEQAASYMTLALDVLLLIIISFIADFITRRIILGFVSSYVKRSKSEYDDIFLEKKVFTGLAHLVPALIIYYSLPWLLDDIAIPVALFQKLVSIYMIVIFLMVIARFLRSLEYIGLRTERFEGKPISSYIQVFILTTYIIGGILIISMIIGRSPLTILTAFGAATAVILLIFRDTILGLVASIQIAANDMVRLGDWVSLDKYGADGDVIEINLTSVKVRNWDKTITTVPTYSFIADSFKNWRGMQSMGVRRIKRSINIDISSIQFVSEEMRDRFMKYERVKDYVKQRQSEIDQYNSEAKVDKSELINGRHMTNIGVFRRYALRYLEEHPKIDQKETVMVRQLQPTEEGLPMEIYAFSNDIAWVNYENIQSDIFDHLMASVSKFDLRIFQNPSGADFKSLNIKSEGDDPSTSEAGSQKE
ncbi:MAG TPA: mechanosensitive ion channel protein MscS [Cryomorphaceae bacterium]|nr:mechanosensitive ion channel protein MscS [Owenweeksia sp.]MBF98495.1 mechanosensitive ion channel protein MscS [Owenweeksia sp.]HAD96599.1 mechanosensitive ion channel protein MscS [Cryomorphaceae bacterium]HBF19185.1 mechanosensitive ion channel protein MscS [Cryomorphaceae bacterium]|tara:strand:+ start:629 stop:1939 length:1311 start_codon:yes stop_codon:yes gene_type:complete